MSTTDYSPDYSEGSQRVAQPLELEAATSEPARVPGGSEQVDGLTLTDAASAYGVSVPTLRRLLKAGKLPGAGKVPGPKGTEYRIPAGALEALGYKPKQSQAGAVLTASRAELETELLGARVRELEASLETERVLRAAAEKETELLRANLEDLRSALSKLPPALEPAPRARRWWKPRG